MTILNETFKTISLCNGVATTFAYEFPISDEDELQVILYTIASGFETTLTNVTDYTVSGVGDTEGEIETVETYSSDYKIICRRNKPYTQTTDLVLNDPRGSAVIEEGLDKLMMSIQQVAEISERLIIADSSNESGLTFPALVSGQVLTNNGSTLSWTDMPETTLGSFNGSLLQGADADKSATPSVGSLYFAVDTKIFYRCFTLGTWTPCYYHYLYDSSAKFTLFDSSGDTIATIDHNGNLKIKGTIEDGGTF